MSLVDTNRDEVKKKVKSIVDTLLKDGIPYAAVRGSDMSKFVAADERYISEMIEQIKGSYGEDDEEACVFWLLRCLFVGTVSTDKIVEEVSYVSYVDRAEDFLRFWASSTMLADLYEKATTPPVDSSAAMAYADLMREMLKEVEVYTRSLKLKDVLKHLNRRIVK